MIFPILAEYALVFIDEKLYHFLRKVITEFFDDLNLQIWFPKEVIETLICTTEYICGKGKSMVSIMLYEDVEEFKKEIVTEIELLVKKKTLRFLEPVLILSLIQPVGIIEVNHSH